MVAITQKQIINNAGNIPASLVRAVIRQMGGMESFKESAPNVYNHGISGGYSGFIWYSETLGFYAKNQKAIVELAENEAKELGTEVLSMVQSFSCIGKDWSLSEIGYTLFGTRKQHDTSIANGLAWYAAEEVCRVYMYLVEQGA